MIVGINQGRERAGRARSTMRQFGHTSIKKAGCQIEIGALVCADDRYLKAEKALTALENGLEKWFDDQGIELNQGDRP